MIRHKEYDVTLTEKLRAELELGVRSGESAVFGRRCKIILMCADHISSEAIAEEVDLSVGTVENVIRVYRKHGIEGIQGKQRKPKVVALSGCDPQVIAHRKYYKGKKPWKNDFLEMLGFLAHEKR